MEQMRRWFDETALDSSAVLYSRVRLVRNWNQYPFPLRMTNEAGKEMVARLFQYTGYLQDAHGNPYQEGWLDQLSELERIGLKERHILNSSLLERKALMGIMMSQDEKVSMIFNGTDHIRIQVIEPGLHLKEAFRQVDILDDKINEKISYAFDPKYGYLTSFPTNVGTGLRALVVLHLPSLSKGKKFNNLIAEMGRFGTSVRGLNGEGSENYGDLYVVSNQKTLGQSEKEIIDVVNRVAFQLVEQEKQVRERFLEGHRLDCEDEIYKSYGVLKYARKLSMKEAMTYLSQILMGVSEGILKWKEPYSIYSMMLGIQPANLKTLSDRPLDKTELEEARARYIREELPKLQ